MRFNHLLAALALGACVAAQAQAPAAPAAPASPLKKELVQKLLALQQPGIELAARGLVERPAAQMLQEAGRVLQTQIPPEKREAIGKTIEADAKRYVDEALPLVAEAHALIGRHGERYFEPEVQRLMGTLLRATGRSGPTAC